jgi:uncharacterized membrane protein YedE/YeeE
LFLTAFLGILFGLAVSTGVDGLSRWRLPRGLSAALIVVTFFGLLVGFGTRMGSGCTSGHGVCGLGRLSLRSLVAVITFMATGMIATYVTRHLLGVAS